MACFGKTSLCLSWKRTEIPHRKIKKAESYWKWGKWIKEQEGSVTNIPKENQKNRAKEFSTGPKACRHCSLWSPWREQSEPQLDAETRQTFGLTWKSHPSGFVLLYDTLGTQPFYWEKYTASQHFRRNPQGFAVPSGIPGEFEWVWMSYQYRTLPLK